MKWYHTLMCFVIAWCVGYVYSTSSCSPSRWARSQSTASRCSSINWQLRRDVDDSDRLCHLQDGKGGLDTTRNAPRESRAGHAQLSGQALFVKVGSDCERVNMKSAGVLFWLVSSRWRVIPVKSNAHSVSSRRSTRVWMLPLTGLAQMDNSAFQLTFIRLAFTLRPWPPLIAEPTWLQSFTWPFEAGSQGGV